MDPVLKILTDIFLHIRLGFPLFYPCSKLCFGDMKIMPRRSGGDSENNESAGRVVYQITTIPESL